MTRRKTKPEKVPTVYILTGLPKDVTAKEIREFLANSRAVKKNNLDLTLGTLRRFQKSASVEFQCKKGDQLSKDHFRAIGQYFGQFRGSKHVELGRVPKKKQKQPKQPKTDLALQFWKFVVSEKNMMICDRGDLDSYFLEFCRSIGATDLVNGTGQNRKSRLVQAFSQMRKTKVAKTVCKGDLVLALFASPKKRKFPTKQEVAAALSKLRKKTAVDTSNKNGVAVSVVPLRIMGTIGTTETITFEVKVDNSLVNLASVNVTGANESLFQFAQTNPKFPARLGASMLNSVSIGLTVTPTKITVLRAKVLFHFEGDRNFVVHRPIVMSCAHHLATNEALQPRTPYQRPQRKQLRFDTEKTIDPNPAGGDPSPYKEKLKKYKLVPYDVKNSMRKGTFDKEMSKIGWSNQPSHNSIHNYTKYWRRLLYATEYQLMEEIKLYDIEKSPLRREGYFFALSVPGLAEGRPSVLRGDSVLLSFQGRVYRGKVKSVKLLEVILDLHPSFGKAFKPALDRVSVRFTFSRTTLKLSHHAVEELAVSALGESILLPSTKHVMEFEAANASKKNEEIRISSWANRSLNPEQADAVKQIVNARLRPMPYIIYGPPGTGKTTTVVEVIYQLAKRGKKILLVAPSNDASDVLGERLASYFPPTEMRRILSVSRSIDSLPAKLKPYASDSIPYMQQATEIRSAQIVVSTVNLAARFSFWGIPRGYFDVLCVDEAGHVTEPEVVATAASLMDFHGPKASGQFILAGDPNQLGPISNSDICRKYGFTMSLLERLSKRSVYVRQPNGEYPKGLLTKLVRNYRSHPSILKLPNEMFYSDLQACGDLMVTMNMARWEHLPKLGFPVVFHAVNGENLREGTSPSWFNPTEAQQVAEYVRLLTQETRPPVRADEIGIITPYARQAQKIRLALKLQEMNEVKVGSVESFQGQERRVIILSTVRALREEVKNDLRYNLGFVAHSKRFNVAITRAKALLIVIGCPSVLEMDKEHWLPFLKYCRENVSWVGEEWNFSDDCKDTEPLSPDSDSENIDSTTRVAEEEGYAFFRSEE